MTQSNKRKPSFPNLCPGSWRGEIAGGCSVNFGREVQDGPPRQSVEFSYAIMPALLTMPEGRFTWPGVVMIMAPTPMKPEHPDAGCLFKAGPLSSLTLSLDVTREQFSDLLRMLEAKRLREFHFTLEDERDGTWPIRSWGMGASIG